MNVRLAVVAILAVSAAACGPVRKTSLRPDYDQVDKHRTKRLAIVTHPAPDGNPQVAELWTRVARDYVNLKRQYIVREQLGAQQLDGALEPAKLCGEGIDGVLWLQPKMTRRNTGFETEVKAQLVRCTDGQEVWSAEAGGSWPSEDKKLEGTTNVYVEEFGPEVKPYVAPTFQLLRATLDTLPDVVLTDEEKDEKIEYSAVFF